MTATRLRSAAILVTAVVILIVGLLFVYTVPRNGFVGELFVGMGSTTYAISPRALCAVAVAISALLVGGIVVAKACGWRHRRPTLK